MYPLGIIIGVTKRRRNRRRAKDAARRSTSKTD
jgi:hypothetical protein